MTAHLVAHRPCSGCTPALSAVLRAVGRLNAVVLVAGSRAAAARIAHGCGAARSASGLPGPGVPDAEYLGRPGKLRRSSGAPKGGTGRKRGRMRPRGDCACPAVPIPSSVGCPARRRRGTAPSAHRRWSPRETGRPARATPRAGSQGMRPACNDRKHLRVRRARLAAGAAGSRKESAYGEPSVSSCRLPAQPGTGGLSRWEERVAWRGQRGVVVSAGFC